MGAITMEKSMAVPQKIKIEQLYDTAIPFLGISLKETKMLTRKDICTRTFIAAVFTRAKTQKQPKCPLMDKVLASFCFLRGEPQ